MVYMYMLPPSLSLMSMGYLLERLLLNKAPYPSLTGVSGPLRMGISQSSRVTYVYTSLSVMSFIDIRLTGTSPAASRDDTIMDDVTSEMV